MSVYILSLSLSLLLLFNRWVETSCDVLQESIKSYTSSSNQKNKEILLTVHTDDPLTLIINGQKKLAPKNSKTKYTALLHVGALINCSPASLRGSCQILLFQ